MRLRSGMINIRLMCLTAIFIACMAIQTASSAEIITADEAGNSLTKIGADGARQTIEVPIAPHNVQVSTDNTLILATGMNAANHTNGAHMSGGTLLVMPVDSFKSESVRIIPLGQHLAHVITDATSQLAYVTDSASNSVLMVDIQSGAVKNTISVGSYPHGMRMNPQRPEIYTANVKDGTLSIIDSIQNKELKRVPIGKMPIQVAVSPNGQKVYISLSKDNAVAVVDVTQRRKIKTISVGTGPAQIHTDPLGRYIYVANQGTNAQQGTTVSIIDSATDKVIKIIHAGKMPHGIVTSADGKFAYITNMADNTVSQMDVGKFSIINTYAVGKLPNGITLIEGKH